MAIQIEDCVQRGHYYAIVDEVDSVLIDEARTPLIISGPVSHSSHQFDKWKPQIERLFSLQTRLINKLIADAEGLLDDEERREEAARMLLQARRGAPKNKKLMKLLKDGQVAKLIHKVEGDLMVEKTLHTLDDDLYYSIDERGHVIDLTEKGQEALYSKDPEFFILPDIETETQASSQREDLTVEEKERAALEIERRYLDKKEILHNIQQLLRAYSLFEKDDQYVLHEGKVLIVDEFTGRLMPGRRYSDGLHQALEAKEGVQIERETQTLATITLQNYFRLYKKLAGMTGTAETEASEFYEIYKLDVQVIPTHLPVCRTDHDDVIFRTKREKFNAVIEEIQEMYAQRRPVLVGTTSVESSETVSRLLRRTGIKHNVLNAKYHQQEAEIVSHAGEQGAVMIATNMAGRGTDIKPDKRILEVVDPKSGEKILGGLHIIGTERHEARRIDRQLRGRAGRQGDPGSSRFYLSLEDDLMRLFGMDRLSGVMARLGMEEGVPIEHPAVTRSIERAQKKVEAQNFQTRKHLLEYDDVMNKQRTAIYSHRREILEGKDQGEYLLDISRDLLDWLLGKHLSDKEEPEAWDLKEFGRQVFHFFGVRPGMLSGKLEELGKAELQGQVCQKIEQRFRSRHQQLGDELASFQERMVMLQVIDRHWREHLYALDGLKEGIGLRGYGQRDPLVEYKRESFELFQAMNESIQEEMLRTLFHLEILPGSRPPEEVRAARPPLLAATHPVGLPGALPPPPTQELTYQGGGEASARPQTVVRQSPKVGRNDPCPCGSGLKYKKCHGKQVG
jgi:preprotein translocase subunit SecA